MGEETLGRAVLALSTDDSGLDSGLNTAQNKAQNWVGTVGKILGGLAIGAAVVKGVDMLVGGFKDVVGEAMSAESATAQLDAVLRSTAAGAESTASAMPQVSEAAGSAISDIASRHAEAITTILETAADQASSVQSRLQDMAESFAQTAGDRQARYNEQIAAGAEQLNERLADLADQHAEREQGVQRQIGDLNTSYGDSRADRQQRLDDNLANLTEQSAEKRTALQEKLALAETDIQRVAITKQLALLDLQEQKEKAKLEARAKQEEDRAKLQYDRQFARIQESMAREEQAYQKQQDKLRKQESKHEAELAAGYERETALAQRNYDKQVVAQQKALAAIEQDKAKALAKEAAASAKAMAALNKTFSAVDLGKIVPYHAIQLGRQAILDLADALAKITPFEDDLILSGETIMLQFTNIGEDVFPTATEAMLNMATRMGNDLPGAAMLLGKALNDPLNSLGAMERVTGKFSEAQKEAIKQMMATGDVAGAQKLILDELEKKMGGAAVAAGTTFAGQLVILQTNLGNIKEEIGGNLIPILSDLTARYAPDVVKAFQSFSDWVTVTGVPKLKELIGWLETNVSKAIGILKDKFNEYWPIISQAVTGAWDLIKGPLGDLKTWLDTTIPAAIIALKGFWDNTLLPAFRDLWDSLSNEDTGLIPAGKLLVDWLRREIPEAFVSSNVAFGTGTTQVGLFKKGLTDLVQPMTDFLKWLDETKRKLNETLKFAQDLGIALNNLFTFKGGFPSFPTIPDFWVKGFAAGTSYAPGGLARVGENGPEVVALPRGSQVYPNGQGPSVGGNISLVQNFYGNADPQEVRQATMSGLDAARARGLR